MWITNENNIIRQPEGIRIGDVNHPASIFWCWSKEQLAEVGIKPYTPASVPAGYRITGAYTEEVDGEPLLFAAVADGWALEDVQVCSWRAVCRRSCS